MAVQIFSLNSAAPKSEYRTIIDYFRNEQVAEYELDFGTGELTILLNDEKKTTITYDVPNLSLFLQDTHELVNEYNEKHPDAPIKQYYDAAEAVPWWLDMLPLLLTVLLMGGFWYLLMKRSGGGSNPMAFAKLKPKQQDPNNRVTFEDVAGADEEKEELEEIVQFLRDPAKFNALGARIPKGVLLMGPPGTGKTLLAKAVAGEAGVPFFSISGSDFVEMFVGVGASRVRDLFEQAKKSAPSIVFIDEIDAVGRHRGSGLGGGHDEREQTLNQLLVEMDGFAPNLGVIVMAATNRKDILDPALLRPGRFDRHITVNYPDVKGREAILRVHTRNKPIGPDVDLAVIARSTGGFTGADLENLTNEAALLAARKNRKAITMEDIQEATLKVVVGPEKRSHVITEKERRLTAYHEAGHAIVTYYCPLQDKVHQVSIVPRGWAGGFTLSLPEKDVSFQTKRWMEEEIAVLLAGRVSEQLVLEDISTGASNDIERATKIARAMVCRYGFSDKLGPMIYGSDQEEVFLGRDLGHGRDYSEEVAGQIDEEARRFIDEGYNKALALLEEHMDQLHALAEYLMKYEKIEGDVFADVMSGVLSFGEAAEKAEQELQRNREKAERAQKQLEAQQKAAEEKKAQQGFSVDPLDFRRPDDPGTPPPEEDSDRADL
ncbi:MAG: ATP-dependent zinc metalloprotease FtsH [Angelakisella sp.]